MIKDYYVHIPPHLFDVLQDLGNTTSEDFDVVIEASRAQLFNFLYPVPVADKEALEKFIMNRFILRRVGSGNIRKWRQMFKSKILEIMPYYNNLLASEHLSYDPLINNDITTTDDGEGTLDTTRDKRTDNDDAYTRGVATHDEHSGTGTHADQYFKSGSETASSRELNRYLDTPQGDSSRVWETDGQGNVVLSDYYITDVRGITTDANRSWNENGSSSGNTTDAWTKNGTVNETGSDQRDIVEHEVIDTDTTSKNENVKLGVSGSSKSKLLTEYRETFLRIYSDIVMELEPLFYNLVEIDDILDFV